MASTAGYRRGPLGAVWPSPAFIGRRRIAKRADEEYGASATPDWREIDWHEHQRQIEIDGHSVNYVELGADANADASAETVVFVHGLGGCWQNWLENMPFFAAQGRRVVALDLPGFGRSEMPDEPISITLFAKTVDALADALDLGPVAIVGNSMGGFTAAEIAIRYPRRAERLVLVDAAGISVAAANAFTRLLGKTIVSAGHGDRERAMRVMRRPGYRQVAFGAIMRHPTRLQRDLLVEQGNGVGAPGFGPAIKALLSYDFRDRLPEIACPTLIVQGTNDVLVPRGDAYEFERLIARSTMVELEETGHVPMLERPRTFNRAVAEFLDQEVSPHKPTSTESPTLSEGEHQPV